MLMWSEYATIRVAKRTIPSGDNNNNDDDVTDYLTNNKKCRIIYKALGRKGEIC